MMDGIVVEAVHMLMCVYVWASKPTTGFDYIITVTTELMWNNKTLLFLRGSGLLTYIAIIAREFAFSRSGQGRNNFENMYSMY